MKIEGEVVTNLTVGDLNEGDVFAKDNGFLYMKTDSQDDEYTDIKVNAVFLNNGQLIWVDEDEEVFRVNGKFVIEG